MPIKDGSQIRDLKDYLEDQNHPNHQLGVTVGKVQFWRTSDADFVSSIEKQADLYRRKAKGPGAPWKGEIAEHMIFAPPAGIFLSKSERAVIAEYLLERMAPGSPALYAWHVGDDGRDELHIVASNFTGQPPELRITTIRDEHDGDYKMLAMAFGREVIAILNEARALFRSLNPTADAPQPIPTLSDVRQAKRSSLGVSSLPEIVFKGLGPADCLDRVSICEFLGVNGWGVRNTPKNISVIPPAKKKSYRWRWDTLLMEIQALRDEWWKKFEKRDDDIEKDNGPDRDVR